MIKIGIVGSGFISKGLLNLIIAKKEFQVSSVLTRSKITTRGDFLENYLTNSIQELIDNSDIVVECSGDVVHATEVISRVMENNIPVITMNTEFHVAVGSYFVDKGFITEAEGDQPGSIAVLNEEVISMGFKPLVFGNIKGFLNQNPTLDEMKFWAKKSNLSLENVISFTDGTKLQMEQALVANGLKATILKTGLTGLEGPDIRSHGNELAKMAEELGENISDYVISAEGPPGIFITATHDKEQHKSLAYYKQGEGPYYTLVKPYHLPHLEIYKTIIRVVNGGKVLLNNGKNPTISVAGITKKDLHVGHKIHKAIGSFDIRGEAIKMKDYKNHIPIGLINDVVLKKEVKKGNIITFDDVEISNNLAIEIWNKIIKANGDLNV